MALSQEIFSFNKILKTYYKEEINSVVFLQAVEIPILSYLLNK